MNREAGFLLRGKRMYLCKRSLKQRFAKRLEKMYGYGASSYVCL